MEGGLVSPHRRQALVCGEVLDRYAVLEQLIDLFEGSAFHLWEKEIQED